MSIPGRRSIRSPCFECLETKPDTEGQKKATKFKWVTNCHIPYKRVTALANDGGRMRWTIENEGFSVQKRGGYGLEHAYTTPPGSFTFCSG